MQDNPVVFWELASHDQDGSAKFFREVFGWDVKLDERIGFYRVNAPAGPDPAHGYIFTLKRAKLPFVAVYIQVKDIKVMRDRVVEHGGHIVLEPEEPVPGSWVCLFNEPSGVTFAMVEERPARKPED
jgi:predicted enzyme related to lactoylglutathione lyase